MPYSVPPPELPPTHHISQPEGTASVPSSLEQSFFADSSAQSGTQEHSSLLGSHAAALSTVVPPAVIPPEFSAVDPSASAAAQSSSQSVTQNSVPSVNSAASAPSNPQPEPFSPTNQPTPSVDPALSVDSGAAGHQHPAQRHVAEPSESASQVSGVSQGSEARDKSLDSVLLPGPISLDEQPATPQLPQLSLPLTRSSLDTNGIFTSFLQGAIAEPQTSTVQDLHHAATDATLLGPALGVGLFAPKLRPVTRFSLSEDGALLISQDDLPRLPDASQVDPQEEPNGGLSDDSTPGLLLEIPEPQETLEENAEQAADEASESIPSRPSEEDASQDNPAQNGPENVPIAPSTEVVELDADYQEYDEVNQSFLAEGNVTMRFQSSLLEADRLQVNLPNRIAVGTGDVVLIRGNQTLRGQRFEYNFVQGDGTIFESSGEIFIPDVGDDFSPDFRGREPLSDRLTSAQPQSEVQSPGGLEVNLGSTQGIASGPDGISGRVNKLRFEADKIDFYPEGWVATNVRVTNDPFSPPELEVRARTATLTRISPTEDRIDFKRSRLVFDQGLAIPLPSSFTIDRSERDPLTYSIGYDEDERGGLFVERKFTPIETERVTLQVRPQFFIQRAAFEESFNLIDPDVYGLITQLTAVLGPRTTLNARAELTSLDVTRFDEELRASVRVSQQIPTAIGTHILTPEYSFRDRLFNGSLGFQNVQQSIGAVLTSPVIDLDGDGTLLRYQVGGQYITANTDQADLLPPLVAIDEVDLGRFQTSVALNRNFLLWRGEPLPATKEEGLRYTPRPIVPFLQVITGIRGSSSFYTSGDTQNSLTGSVGLRGQFGHFSRPFLDYTGFQLLYSGTLSAGESPFLFDRIVDRNVLRAGITQQIYGPFRFGFQTRLNLDTGNQIDTNFILEYSRRTYGLQLVYNPERQTGAFNFRLSDFNWKGGADSFDGPGVKTVEDGVVDNSN